MVSELRFTQLFIRRLEYIDKLEVTDISSSLNCQTVIASSSGTLGLSVTYSRTGRRAAWCCLCGFRGGSCICRGPGARSRGGFCPWPSLSSRRGIARGLASVPA